MRLLKKNYSKRSDEELMSLYIKGDRKAFEEIYHRYGNYLFNFFNRKLWQNREKAEDFTQELFTKLIDKPEQFDINKKFKTWLFTIASNMCKNEYKRTEIRKRTKHTVPESFEAKSNLKPADKTVDETNFSVQLNAELLKLNEKHKEVFMLRHFDGLTMKEIAEILDINVGTVKSRLHNTTKLLAKKLATFNILLTE
ncbi:MAG TPA: RNA polymerase sigma factor [Crocinitomix sp.]|nr:RNA polymerase sigma factor [Crocinitomix sp.]